MLIYLSRFVRPWICNKSAIAANRWVQYKGTLSPKKVIIKHFGKWFYYILIITFDLLYLLISKF